MKNTKFGLTMAFIVVLATVSLAYDDISLDSHFAVPKKYLHQWDPRPPNGQQERVRYAVAYEAFWWNCVGVRAADLHGRCPFLANGTPAASEGALDGARSADSQIEALLKKHRASAVQRHLKSICSTARARDKMRPYFEKPTPEVIEEGKD